MDPCPNHDVPLCGSWDLVRRRTSLTELGIYKYVDYQTIYNPCQAPTILASSLQIFLDIVESFLTNTTQQARVDDKLSETLVQQMNPAWELPVSYSVCRFPPVNWQTVEESGDPLRGRRDPVLNGQRVAISLCWASLLGGVCRCLR